MPEYLAPGVYVEEIDTGAKPIEGVSTSTCGVVGVAERGPVDVPVLVTSVGEYFRWFGGLLRAGDDYGDHRFLPHAIEGFFTNGGKRVYVVRTLDPSATRARSSLFDRGDANSVSTRLVRSAGEGTGTSVLPPDVLVVSGTGLNANDTVRIGDGSSAEYREVATVPVTENVMVVLDLPLSRSHPDTEQAHEIARQALTSFTAANPVSPGDTTLVVEATTTDLDDLETAVATGAACLELAVGAVTEYRLVLEVTGKTAVGGGSSTGQLLLDAPVVSSYPAATVLTSIDLTAAAVDDQDIDSATAGDALAFLETRNGNFDTPDNLVIIGDSATREVRRIGQLSELAVAPGAAEPYATGYIVDAVDFTTRQLSAPAAAGDTTVTVRPGEAAGLAAGESILVDSGGADPHPVTVTAVAGDVVTFLPALGAPAAAGALVAPAARLTTAEAAAGSRTLALDNRIGITLGGILEIGSGSSSQIVTVTSVPAVTGVAPDRGNVVIDPPLSGAHATGATVQLPGPAVSAAAGVHVCALGLSADQGATTLLVTDGRAFAGHHVRVSSPSGGAFIHSLTQPVAVATPDTFQLTTPLARSHPSGSGLVARDALFDVEALDAGSWGNRLRVSVTDDAPGLVSRTTLDSVVSPTTIRLGSRSGVQPGTVLELSDPVTGALLEPAVKVRSVDRTTGNIVLSVALTAPQQQIGVAVRSREFTIEVVLLRQPDPATPSRDGQVIDRETFRNLSLDPRHSNYVGEGDRPDQWAPAQVGPPHRGVLPLHPGPGPRRPDRPRRLVRLGPEPLIDRLPDGRLVPARTATGDGGRRRLDRLAHRRPLSRYGRGRPRAAHRAAEPAQRRADQPRLRPGGGQRASCSRG